MLINFDSPPLDQRDERLLEFVRAIRPMTSANLTLERIGGPHDGGYVMATPVVAAGAISIGIGPDVSWDQGVAKLGIPVAMFDPTIRRLPRPVSGGRFYRIGIGPASYRGRYRSLNGLLELAGIPEDGDLLLKLDVEGAEWSSLQNISSADLRRFAQVVVELHRLEELAAGEEAVEMLAVVGHLRETHTPIHVHANNYGQIVRFGRYWFPSTVEVSYVRNELLEDSVPAPPGAVELDAPCDPRVAEVALDGLYRLEV